MYPNIHRALRTDDNWKLIKCNVNGVQTTQLFDLNRDPYELTNLAESDEHGGRIEELTGLLRTYMPEYADFCDLDRPDWVRRNG